ncbi:hypothetical protein [Priestia endophytica]|uniref:hypothetical protein n=1 Tax=Priestia endophytica TaxID=135735 RepID=UPI002E238002|nr:hypothetical protein [Priestia endophytica]
MREYLDEKNPIVLYHTMRTSGDYLVYDEKVLEGLKELSLHTSSADKLLGYYKVGHLAMVTLKKLGENIEELALNQGGKYVREKLKEHGIDDVLDIKRENIAKQ